MNKEKLNEIMNCECLQSVIENDKNKHTIEYVDHGGVKTTKISNDSKIIFECVTSYRVKKIDNRNYIIKNRNEEEFCGIPFLYCPICGSRTKLDIPKKTFYDQFQK
jgi:hypothetical protein